MSCNDLGSMESCKKIHAFDTFVFRYKSHSATVHFQDYFINCCLREYPKIFNYTIIVNIMMGGHQAGPSVNPQPCAACWHTFRCTIWSEASTSRIHSYSWHTGENFGSEITNSTIYVCDLTGQIYILYWCFTLFSRLFHLTTGGSIKTEKKNKLYSALGKPLNIYRWQGGGGEEFQVQPKRKLARAGLELKATPLVRDLWAIVMWQCANRLTLIREFCFSLK